MVEVKLAETQEELESCYELRWKVLRKPWNQPRGSERDELDAPGKSWSALALEEGHPVGTGRLHKNSAEEGQIRFLCVEQELRGRGIGKIIMDALEEKARELGLKKLIANVRQIAEPFYLKRGWKTTGKSHTLFGDIPHVKMEKEL